LLSTAAFVSWGASTRTDDTELTTHMKSINTSMRKLRAALKDPKRADEASELILDMQTHALAAKALTPVKHGEVKEDERPQFIIDYRKGMHEMINGMFKMEVAVLEGRQDDATEEMKGLLKAKSPAHEKFQSETIK
jgi:soluble cytochrome b562